MAARPPLPEPTAARLPRWRGFNLQEMFVFNAKGGESPRDTSFRESDFELMAEWGFNFVRLPLDYRIWTQMPDLFKFKEDVFERIDRAIALGKKHEIHVSLNFHRAPGWCINAAKERPSLWDDDECQRAFAHHWAYFAKRYRGIPNRHLTFNLVNEPVTTAEKHDRVIRRAVEAIRAQDRERLIIIDGLNSGFDPVPSLADLGVAQSLHSYAPYEISCYQAEWFIRPDPWPEPSWPMKIKGKLWNRQTLYEDCVVPWKQLEAKGVGVHVGEAGCYRHTPLDIAWAWTKDWFDLINEAGWGWAMWTLRGPIGGPLDSRRSDVEYEDFRGHKLDRRFLELLQAS